MGSALPAPSLLDLARQMQIMRARAVDLFPREVFRDSAWDLMLELFVAEQQKRLVCVKELILVSGETSTSALRRIDALEAAQLLRRCNDPADHRRVSVALTVKGGEAMRAVLHSLYLANDPVVERSAKVHDRGGGMPAFSSLG